MRLKKIIAGYFDKNGQWTDQREVEMHPLEEDAVRAHWRITQASTELAEKLTLTEEHDLLISGGIEAVRAKRDEYDESLKVTKESIEQSYEDFLIKDMAWNKHAMLCHANNADPDTFEGNAADSLPPPIPLKMEPEEGI